MKKETKKEYKTFSLTQESAQEIFDKLDFGKVQDISSFKDGMVNDIFLLNDKYVLKVNSSHPEIPKMAREAAVYRKLRDYGVLVPVLHDYYDGNGSFEYPYVLIDKVPGLNLKDQWDTLSQEKKNNLIFELGKILASIHSVNPKDLYLDEDITFSGNVRKDIDDRITKIAQHLRSSKVLEDELVNRIESYYKESEAFNLGYVQSSLSHGNYGFPNIIVSNGKTLGIIDWEWARFSHSEEELATVLYRGLAPSLFIGNEGEDLLNAFKRGYNSIYKISEKFEERYLMYALLYFLKILPDIVNWNHKPDKQEEYMSQAMSLIKEIGI